MQLVSDCFKSRRVLLLYLLNREKLGSFSDFHGQTIRNDSYKTISPRPPKNKYLYLYNVERCRDTLF